ADYNAVRDSITEEDIKKYYDENKDTEFVEPFVDDEPPAEEEPPAEDDNGKDDGDTKEDDSKKEDTEKEDSPGDKDDSSEKTDEPMTPEDKKETNDEGAEAPKEEAKDKTEKEETSEPTDPPLPPEDDASPPAKPDETDATEPEKTDQSRVSQTVTSQATGADDGDGDKPADEKKTDDKKEEDEATDEPEAKPEGEDAGDKSDVAEDTKKDDESDPAEEEKKEDKDKQDTDKEADKESKADNESADKKTDEELPTDKKDDDKEKKPERPVVYEPLDAVRGQIRDKLTLQRITELQEKAFKDLTEKMSRFGARYERDSVEGIKTDMKENPLTDEEVKKYGLTLKTTPWLSAYELSQKDGFGTSLVSTTLFTRLGQRQDSLPCPEAAFNEVRGVQREYLERARRTRQFPVFVSGMQQMGMFQPRTGQDRNRPGLSYLFWKIDEKEAHEPKELADVRQQVVNAWKSGRGADE
ncbi:MAG: hypothetical protein MI757_00310, partial [Pirellulales bacterium]|nr:hypothetical protein [Pirellulales bacterium]